MLTGWHGTGAAVASKQSDGTKQHANYVSHQIYADNVIYNAIKATVLDAENTGEGRQLVKDGKWCVPAHQRPKGWETWPVNE